MHGDARDVIAHQLDLACVQPRSDLETQILCCRGRGLGAANGTSWPVKGREKVITTGIDLPASEVVKVLSHR
jgi:hypothetical protein